MCACVCIIPGAYSDKKQSSSDVVYCFSKEDLETIRELTVGVCNEEFYPSSCGALKKFYFDGMDFMLIWNSAVLIFSTEVMNMKSQNKYYDSSTDPPESEGSEGTISQ